MHQKIIQLMTKDNMCNMFTSVHDQIIKATLNQSYGKRHITGKQLLRMLNYQIHPILDEFLITCGVDKSDDLSVFIIDPLKDSELMLIYGHDINIKSIFQNNPDALFKSVYYEDVEDRQTYPRLSSIIVIEENDITLSKFTMGTILAHEIIHYILEYCETYTDDTDLIQELKNNHTLNELVCDLFSFYYLGNRDMKEAIIKYNEYSDKVIKPSINDVRHYHIDKFMALCS